MTVDEVVRSASRSSAVGAPWLIAFTGSVAVVAALSLVLDARMTAVILLFPDSAALVPAAFAAVAGAHFQPCSWLHAPSPPGVRGVA